MTRSTRIPSWLTLCGVLMLPLALVPQPAAAAEIERCDQVRLYRDLNGDGFRDAVVGDPYATVSGQAEAGTVTILFGDADGRIGEGGARRTLTQADLGETPEAGDHFGWAVELNRTESGGCFGILIGSPGEDVNGQADAGMAHMLTLAPVFEDRPDEDWKVNFDQGETGGTVEAGDEFGYSLAALGGSNEDPVRFAVGAPGENDDSGVVNITNSSDLTLDGVQLRQGSGGLPGTPQSGDRFGHAIEFVLAQMGAVPVDEEAAPLMISAPGDKVSGHAGAGSVLTTWVSPNTALLGPSRLLTQDTAGIPGKAEAGDAFGFSLAHNTRNALPVADQDLIAIGSPGEDVGSAKDAGSVTVLKNSGIKLVNRLTFTQNSAGIAGTVEAGDRFGASLGFRDRRTMIIGVPGEDVGAVVDAGSAQILRIGKSNISAPYPSLTENSPGTPGLVQTGSRFGSTVTGLPATDVYHLHNTPVYGEAVFAVSSPFQGGGSVYVVSDDSANAPRSWKPGTGGIGGTGVRFGQSVG